MAGNYERGIYNQLMEVMARLDAVEKDLQDEKVEHKEDVDRLNTKINTLTEENELLREDNARMKNLLNHDSSNTSNPPSSDEKGKKPSNRYNGREKTGRKTGAQEGHKGNTLTKADVEEKLRSGRCQHKIKEIGDSTQKEYVTKYVIDLTVETVITEIRIYPDEQGNYAIPPEYRSDVVYGPAVKAMAASLYSEGVMSNDRIAAFLNAVSDDEMTLSEGSIYGFCKDLAKRAELSIDHLENELLDQEAVCTDATTITVNQLQNYIRNFSVRDTVVYRAMEKKTIKALKEIPFLKKYAGILIHDHETALYHFGMDHGECNVHVIRYLRKTIEEAGHTWAKKMIELLTVMNEERKKLIAAGMDGFPSESIQAYEEAYQELIVEGREENRKTKHRYARQDAATLLNRLEKYSHNHLLFLHDFNVYFDDNMSERDLRKVKNRQKMAGGFRKTSGAEMYCSILTIVETTKRRGQSIMENLKRLFEGAPAIF